MKRFLAGEAGEGQQQAKRQEVAAVACRGDPIGIVCLNVDGLCAKLTDDSTGKTFLRHLKTRLVPGSEADVICLDEARRWKSSVSCYLLLY